MSACCYRMNEAEYALTNGSQKTQTAGEFSDEYGESASFALSLLADVYRRVCCNIFDILKNTRI